MKYVNEEDMKVVGDVKRVLEWITMDAKFIEEYYENPKETLTKIGIDIDPEEIVFEPSDGKVNSKMYAKNPGTAAEKYANFINSKIDAREQIKLDCEPSNKSMKKWRLRQIGRCNMQLGARVVGLIQSPFAIEIADGCSVGCEFCGLNAGRLKSVYKYTDENAKLFRDVLNYMKETIGTAAGQATMYFASEPLDNPDYEKFLADFIDIYGRIPQITTAAAMRHKDRLHKLLAQLNEDGGTIYRFSVLSLDIFKQIVEEFTPEELTLVELLPQFVEAPSNHFAKVGREAMNNGDEYDDTISCISGFVVNMARKEVRLTTPAPASKEHPTGEIILYKGNFTDIESFKEVITHCIKTYMSNILGPNEEFKLRDGVKFIERDGKKFIAGTKGLDYELKIEKDSENSSIYEKLFDIMSKEYHTRREIVSTFQRTINGVMRPELLFFIINKLWKMGVLETKSGSI